MIEAALTRARAPTSSRASTRSTSPATLRQAIEGTVFHAIGLPGPPARRARATSRPDRARDLRSCSALARGLSNQAIGKELWVAEQTVKFHLTNIYRKLDVANRTEAVRLAYQHGIIDNPIYDS